MSWVTSLRLPPVAASGTPVTSGSGGACCPSCPGRRGFVPSWCPPLTHECGSRRPPLRRSPGRSRGGAWRGEPRGARAHTPASVHSARRLQQVMPEPKPSSCGRCSQAIPVCNRTLTARWIERVRAAPWLATPGDAPSSRDRIGSESADGSHDSPVGIPADHHRGDRSSLRSSAPRVLVSTRKATSGRSGACAYSHGPRISRAIAMNASPAREPSCSRADAPAPRRRGSLLAWIVMSAPSQT